MNDKEYDDNAVGCFRTFIEEWRGYSEGEIIEDCGTQYVVRLSSGHELTVSRDDVMVCF